ncbi:hypothetical protein C2G38_2224273 [Gigaspora rosea]|uniref:Uncharacterized protein n=1 Tax=Gigaspora rosea TaxID=44941 RepID=A0A397U8T1_9GLOM|nr:hypothetical protein C2G38_2224273 [Gigaspora rosea]
MSWTILYSIPLLIPYIDKKIIEGWTLYILAVQKCCQYTLTIHDINEINSLLQNFYLHYERVYGQYNQEQLSVFTITFHYLLHVAYSICQYGPSWTYWQYPIECLIGILQPTINSHLHPYTNLVNNILLLEQFNHLKYILINYNDKDNKKLILVIKYFIKLIVMVKNSGGLQNIIQLIQKVLNLNIYFNSIEKAIVQIFKHANGYIIGSKISLRNKDILQDNSCIMYFVHEYNDASVILAYIEWANISNENNHQFGLKKFWYFGHKDFIDVKAIKRCVGFFKFDNDIIY